MPRTTVVALRAYLDQVVLFRSPTGEYAYGQMLAIRTRRRRKQADRLISSATIMLEPVAYEGLI